MSDVSGKHSKLRTARTVEERTIAHLEAQDEVLERMEKKLESPALNGGFESLMAQVSHIAEVNSSIKEAQKEHDKKIDEIHQGIYNPEKGLYVKVQDHTKWINHANWIAKGVLGITATGMLTAIGKLLYDLFQGHIHYVP